MQLAPILLNQWLGLLPAKYWGRVKQPFFYTADFLPATASTTTNVAVAINSDSDFAWYFSTRTAFSTDNTTLLTSPYHTVTITDAGSGRQFMSAAVHIDNMMGTAQLPYSFIKPIILGGGSTLTVAVTALGATDRNIRIVLHGLKLFPMQE